MIDRMRSTWRRNRAILALAVAVCVFWALPVIGSFMRAK